MSAPEDVHKAAQAKFDAASPDWHIARTPIRAAVDATWDMAMERAAKLMLEALWPCQHDLGTDKEIGPLGCSLGDGCVCCGAIVEFRRATKDEGNTP